MGYNSSIVHCIVLIAHYWKIVYTFTVWSHFHHTFNTLSSHFHHTFITLSSHFLIRPNRVISQLLVALFGEKLLWGQYKKSSLQRQSQDSFSFRAGTIFWEPKICYPIPPNPSPNQERRNRQESFLTHPCWVQKTLICFANYKKASISLRTELHFGCPQ